MRGPWLDRDGSFAPTWTRELSRAVLISGQNQKVTGRENASPACDQPVAADESDGDGLLTALCSHTRCLFDLWFVIRTVSPHDAPADMAIVGSVSIRLDALLMHLMSEVLSGVLILAEKRWLAP
ncbi:MAG: hypothetical protein E6J90_24895 [Deltaproteobacteria bacterium]|nr:MAG: hypothetical protein E6J91_25450 [Deltaproteobacteria bacterium]TMQ15783.1 MAG: hypothetical protein E6J90_24895 [Deltaproteobacteria bacterium]